jgi:Flp pilus assembly protein TadD
MSKRRRRATPRGDAAALAVSATLATSEWPRALVGAASLILLCVTLATFWPVREQGAIPFDDPRYLTENSVVQSGLTLEGARWAFGSSRAYNFHPLTWFSHMLDVELFGMALGAHHLSNVAHHALASLLLFWILVHLTGLPGRAFAVALLFAIHPLRVESVAWLAERKDTLSAVLWMATLLCWGRHARGHGRAWYWIALGVYLLGLLAKPMLVSLPLVLLLLDGWPLRRFVTAEKEGARGSTVWRLVREKVPFFLAAAALSVLTLFAQAAIAKPLDAISLSLRAVNALVTPVLYLRMVFWPTELAIFYPYDAHRLPAALVFGSALLLVAVTVVSWCLRHRHPYLLVGWGWYLVTLLPVLGLVQTGLQSRADRYTYLPSVGIALMVVWGVAELLGRRRPRRARLEGALLLALAAVGMLARTRDQLATWRDPRVLYQHAIAVTEGNHWAHYNLAQWQLRTGDVAGAAQHFAATVALDPVNANAWRNLGLLQQESGGTAQALESLARAVALEPSNVFALRDYALAALAAGEVELASRLADRALEAAPADLAPEQLAGLYYCRGIARLRLEDAEQAEHALRQALVHDPRHAPAHNALGTLLAQSRRLADAVRHFELAAEAAPDYAEAQRNLTRARAMLPQED